MKLDLTHEEAQDLNDALKLRLIAMRQELVKTSDHAYRDELRGALIRLEELEKRLEGEMEFEEKVA